MREFSFDLNKQILRHILRLLRHHSVYLDFLQKQFEVMFECLEGLVAFQYLREFYSTMQTKEGYCFLI